MFGMLGETLELHVAASNRDCYAQGALLAADWLVGQAARIVRHERCTGIVAISF